MKQTIRSFSIGLLTASVLILIVYYTTNSYRLETTPNGEEEMIASLEEKGYKVLNESDYISMAVEYDESRQNENEKKKDDKKIKEKEQKDNDKEKEKKEEKNKKIHISVTKGMPPSEISNRLEEEGIIDDARKFDKYLEDNDYVKYIQLGDYTFKKGMSEKDIAKKLTK